MGNEINNEIDSKFNLVKWIITIIGIAFVVILTILEFSREESNMKTYFLFLTGLIVFWGLIFFGTTMFKNWKLAEARADSKDKIPEIFSEEELKKIIKAKIESFDYWNHIKRWGKVVPYTIGNNLIYQFKFEFLHKDKHLGWGCNYLINAHYPHTRYAILPENEQQKNLTIRANNLSMNPDDSPIVEESETRNDITGVTVRTKRIKPKDKIKVEPKQKTEDLA